MSEWFTTWAERHAAAFGLTADGDLVMLLAWERALAYSADELSRSTDWLLRHPETLDQYRPKAERHMVAIHQAVHQARSLEAKQANEAEQDEQWGTCTLCIGTGYVSVPRLESIVEGEWRPIRVGRCNRPVYYTYVVNCPCALGRWKSSRTEPRMALEEYDAKNPHWRHQLEDRRLEAAAERASIQQAIGPRSPTRLDEILESLRISFGLPEP